MRTDNGAGRISATLSRMPPSPKRRRNGPSVDDLIAQGADLLKQAAALPAKGYHRTPIYRELAQVVTELRSRFVDSEGRADWAGRTFAYRQAVGRLYAESGVPDDVCKQAQSALRYHFGNVQRKAATAEELEDLGLQERAPVDRVKETRDLAASRARAGAALIEKRGRRSATRTLVQADLWVAEVDEDRLREVPDSDVDQVAAALESLSARSGQLLRALEPRRRRGGRRRT